MYRVSYLFTSLSFISVQISPIFDTYQNLKKDWMNENRWKCVDYLKYCRGKNKGEEAKPEASNDGGKRQHRLPLAAENLVGNQGENEHSAGLPEGQKNGAENAVLMY